MATENAPPPDGWQVQPKPWNSDLCCPASCPNLCESPQQAVWQHGEDWWMSDVFTLGEN